MKEELPQKLNRLREMYKAGDSLALIDQLQADLSRLAEEKEVLSHPQFKKFAEQAEKKINDLSASLMNDESNWTAEGKRLAEQRDLWRTVLSAFGIKYRDDAILTLEKVIDDKLNG